MAKFEEKREHYICRFISKEDGRAYWSWNFSWHGLAPVTLEAYWKAKHNGISFTWGGEEAQIGVSLFAFGVGALVRLNHLPIPESWTGIKTKSTYRGSRTGFFYMPKCRSIGLRFWGWEKGGSLHTEQPELNFNFWTTEQFDPDFKGFSVGLPLLGIFGKTQYNSHPFRKDLKVILPMPEGDYEVDVEISLDVWKRPRLPGEFALFRFNIQNEIGIPTGQVKHGVERKQTYMSGPFQEDGGLPEKPIEAAIARYKQSILDDREKYGYISEPENAIS